MNKGQRELFRSLQDSDSLEEVAGGQISKSDGIGAAIRQIVGNPPFKGEVNLQVSVAYYSQAVVGTPVVVAAAAIPAGQKTQLPVFLFGVGDSFSNFAKARQLTSISGWNMDVMSVIIGGNSTAYDYKPLPLAAGAVDYALGSVFFNRLQKGDLLLSVPMTGFVAGAAGTTVTAEILVRCNNVPYATLLNSLSSDLITTNMIRYSVDPSFTAQLNNQINVIVQTIFGKTSTDTLDPTAFITGGTFNKNIADIPVDLYLDKNVTLTTLLNYDTPALNFTITAKSIDKLSAVKR